MITINKNRKLELSGEIVNDENKDFWLLIKVQPTGLERPASTLEEPIQKVAVADGLARVVDDEFVNQYFNNK